jgi:hypothetical protein
MNAQQFCPLPLEGEGLGMGWRHIAEGAHGHTVQERRMGRKRRVDGTLRQGRASTPSQPFPLKGKGSRHTFKRLR